MSEVSVPVALIVPTLTILTILTGLAAGWGVMRWQGHQHEKRLAKLETQAEQHALDLAAFKVEAAQKFVTDGMLARLEERIVGEIARLVDRLDRVFDNRARSARRSATGEDG